jgi:hypothetical protein
MISKRCWVTIAATARTVGFVSCILLLFSRSARAQSALVRGLVSDPTGAVVADAHVSLTNERTGTVEQQ